MTAPRVTMPEGKPEPGTVFFVYRDEIISMAREAGFMDMDSLSAKVTDMFYHGFPRTERIHLCSDDRIERFAELVAAAEREECAALCDRFQARDVGMQPAECAAAIRAMNEKGTA